MTFYKKNISAVAWGTIKPTIIDFLISERLRLAGQNNTPRHCVVLDWNEIHDNCIEKIFLNFSGRSRKFYLRRIYRLTMASFLWRKIRNDFFYRNKYSQWSEERLNRLIINFSYGKKTNLSILSFSVVNTDSGRLNSDFFV